MNYFEWFGLEPTALLDTEALRKAYLQRSREFHPDFHTLQSEEAQQKALENSTYNNLAYRTLLQTGSRLRYLLEMGGHWRESAKLPADFLMEMMELNEEKAMLGNDAAANAQFQQTLQKYKNQLESDFQALLAGFNKNTASEAQWEELLQYYQRWLYLSKI